jgi:alpha-beta hydrolase superfamily lysophospholipase
MNYPASTLMIGLGLLLGSSAYGSPATQPADGGAPPRNGWSADPFRYDRPAKLVVEESTPTAAQADWHSRPPQMKADEPEPVATGPAKPRVVEQMNVLRLRFKDADGEVVPVLLCTPRDRKGPFPVVVAVHGLTSNKAQVCAQVAPGLTRRGFAVIAADMPRHGERPGDPYSVLDHSNPIRSFQLARRAIDDVRQTIDLAESRPELDTKSGVVLVGYSMGSWINSVVGPADDRVRAMVLMVGGAADIPPAALLLPQVAAIDPRLAIAHFVGRPLLLINAKQDPIVKPDMAERLYNACPEPKRQVWYDCGHLLTLDAYEDAAKWIAETVGSGAAKGLKKAE